MKGDITMRKRRRKRIVKQLMVHATVITLLAITALKLSVEAQPKVSVTIATTLGTKEEKVKVELSSTEVHEKVTKPSSKTKMQMHPQFTYDKDWNERDAYLLAKIAMAEAEGENIQTKTLVILTVLNRVQSNDFPDTIEEVILQTENGTHQFSPTIPGGRWYTTEPNEECWEAVCRVQEAIYDYSGGALYFESCASADNWHSRNLEFLYQSENMRFYK